MLSELHFLTPEWLLAFLPLGLILWAIGRRGTGTRAWQRVVDPNLLPHLLVPGGGKGGRLPLILLGIGWLGTVLALANPTFERLPVPAFRGELSRVVVLDLSRSMQATDLKPSRLERARYKVADILERSRDGQVGLIAFAGDAFVVSPLTDDGDTIRSLLDTLEPEIMPVRGSRPDLAIALAAELLVQAGAARGEVVLIGDDAGGDRALAQAKTLAEGGHSLSVIGVGTKEGAPVPGVADAGAGPVIVRLDGDAMRALARAGGGAYAPLSADGSDLDRVLKATAILSDQAQDEAQVQTEVWKELGPWILLAVLPLGALAFRRGWLLAAALMLGNGAMVTEPAFASPWDDLWQRRDQQAAAALERGEHEQALELAEHPRRRGTASYRLGDYQAASEAFATLDDADGHYNRGNSLARAGRLEEAVAAYEQALAYAPNMEDAVHNKALVEELLKRREQQQSGSNGGEQQQNPQNRQPSDDQQSRDQSPANQASSGETEQDEGSPERGPKDADAQQSADQKDQGAQGTDEAAEPRSDQGAEQPQSPAEESAAGRPDDRSDGDTDTDARPAPDAEDVERAAADYRQQAAEHAEEHSGTPTGPATEGLSEHEREERQASDQWLRRIPDDPAGLLRRKFRYQYQRRAAEEGVVTSGNPW